MSGSNLAPWAITFAAVALALSSWFRPVAPPTLLPMSPARRDAATVYSPAPVRVDEGALSEVVDRAVREALAGHERTAPEPDRAAQVAAQDEGLDLVETIIAHGEASEEDRVALRALLGRTDREGGDAILSAYFTALNRGDIRASGRPL